MQRKTVLKAAYTPRKDIKYCSYVGTLSLCELPVHGYHIILESMKNGHELAVTKICDDAISFLSKSIAA